MKAKEKEASQIPKSELTKEEWQIKKKSELELTARDGGWHFLLNSNLFF